MTTPHQKSQTLTEVWSRLRSSRAGARLVNGCRKTLLGKHFEHPERTVEIVTTIAMEYGEKGGGFSLWQVGGGFKVIIWVPPLLYRETEVRADVDEVRRVLAGILHLGEVQLRVIEDTQRERWLRGKGWPLEPNPRTKY